MGKSGSGSSVIVSKSVNNDTNESFHIIPDENMTDGNVCALDEEQFGLFCYKKCELLTQDEHPIRTSAYSCCSKQPCGIWNSKMSSPLWPCSGLSVAGDHLGG